MIDFKITVTFQPELGKSIDTLAFSPSGKNLVITSVEGQISIWDMLRKEEEQIFRERDLRIRQIQFVSSVKFYAMGNSLLKYTIYGPTINNVLSRTPGGNIQSISPDEKWIAAGQTLEGIWGIPVLDDEIFLTVADWKSGKQEYTFPAEKIWGRLQYLNVTALQFSPDNHYLATLVQVKHDDRWEHRLYLLKLGDEFPDYAEDEQSELMAPLCFSPDSDMLAYGCQEGYYIRVIGLASSPHLLHEFYGHEDLITSLAFHPHKPFLASASRDKTLRLWDRSADGLAGLYTHSAAITSLAYHPDGQQMALGDTEGRVCILEANDQP